MVDTFEQLEEQIKDCKKCKLCNNRNHIVLDDGKRDAKIMFIGEGPGADEDAQGKPFVGKAGKLMNQAFKGLGIKSSAIIRCTYTSSRLFVESRLIYTLQ